MRHLLTGVAVVAALAFSAPVWAQPPSPLGGNSMNMPGPNSGGPGLISYSTGTPPSGRIPTEGRATSEPTNVPCASSVTETTSAMPPIHHHAHKGSHAKMTGHHHGKGPQLTGSTTNQLNQEELARLQAGNFSNPSVPPSPDVSSPAPTSTGRMPAGGRATSGGNR
jgi:hypothetical protein